MSQLRDYSDGIRVGVTPYKKGVIYADITPAFQPWYRRLLPWVGNWWFEIESDEGHHIEQDGGAYTFSGAVRRALIAIEEAIEADE